MAYEKQTWATGDIITANKLNHMEDGIAEDSVFVVTFTNDGESITADKTITEVREAYLAGKTIIGKEGGASIFTLNEAITQGAYFEFSRLHVGEFGVSAEAYHYYINERTGNTVINYYTHSLQLESNAVAE